MSQPNRILIYLLRRDLRLTDNPVFNELARLNSQSQKPFTHLLPVFVFPAQQVEVSGFVKPGEKSPYPEARSKVGGFWRCGRLRSKFLAESVWDLKQDLEDIGSGLTIRAGSAKDAVGSILDGFRDQKDSEVHGLWMTKEDAWEEEYEEKDLEALMDREGKEFKLWTDEKYLIHDHDLPFKDPRDLKDVFTSFRNTVEPLREAPRKQLPKPEKLSPLPDHIPPPAAPFEIPDTLNGVIDALHKPIATDLGMPNMPSEIPNGAVNSHPWKGGSKTGLDRVRHLISSGAMTSYKDTRNGLAGEDFSTKLSAWLALGSVSARQVHWLMTDFEDGKTALGKSTQGYGKGENKGTAGVRFELLWRDYMRLCTKKFGTRLFMVDGYRGDGNADFHFISSPFTHSTQKKNSHGANDAATRAAVERFCAGRTGTGLIDASQRELFLTGYTSNRTRQNVASYLSKHLGIDWRLGAEWYECNLVDYDVHSNWGNWQYVAGVGNDPRGSARVFNPVKQAFDYDANGEYVRMWMPELRGVGRESKADGGGVSLKQDKADETQQQDSMQSLMGVFQPWQIPDEERERLGLKGSDLVEKPLIKINFSINRRGGGGAKRGGGGGGGGGGGSGVAYRGQGKGGRGRGKGKGERGGREARSGMMEKAGW